MRTKTKAHKVKGDNGIKKIFNQMTGVEDADPAIIGEKYEAMCEAMDKFVNAWEIFLSSPLCESLSVEAGAAIEDIRKFVRESRETLEVKLKIHNEKIQTDFNRPLIEELHDMANKYDSANLNKTYRELKNSNLSKYIIVTFSHIKTLLKEDAVRRRAILTCLDDPNNLSNTFITQAASSTKILNFSNLDFKFIYNLYNVDVKKFDNFILTLLRVSYLRGNDLYKILNRPDIDVDKFVEAFGKKLEDIKKIIPDCNKAFDCLRKSLKLLKKKFGDYHQEFVKTDNPNIIFELFVEDIKKQNENNPLLLVQFKKIVGYIKSNMPKNMQDNPAVRNLYNMSDKIFGTSEDTEKNKDDVNSGNSHYNTNDTNNTNK